MRTGTTPQPGADDLTRPAEPGRRGDFDCAAHRRGSATLCHGAFLRGPSGLAAGCGLTNPNRPETAPVPFPQQPGHGVPLTLSRGSAVTVDQMLSQPGEELPLRFDRREDVIGALDDLDSEVRLLGESAHGRVRLPFELAEP